MTRHFIALLVLTAGTIATPALPAPPHSGKSGAVEFCQNVILPNVPTANLGECVSYVIVNENGFPSHDCDAFIENDPDLFFQIYDSYSDCVRTLKSE